MTNKKSTKKALLMSCLSLLLCMSMLVGSTFAWFTDSVSTTNNIITAGNLDVNLYWSLDGSNWTPVNSNTNIFKTETLWEPGHTEVVYLKVVNEGTLALKYDLDINVASEISGTNVAGKTFQLSDHILYKLNPGVVTYQNSAAARGDETGNKLNVAYNETAELLEKGKYHEFTMVVFMPTTVGNEANYLTGTTAPSINLGINLFATQFTKENDSYGPDYDANADYVVYYTSGTHELNANLKATKATDVITVTGDGTVLNIMGGSYDAGDQDCAVWAYDGGTVNIYGGEFYHNGLDTDATSANHIDLIYAGSNGGKINVYGGFFASKGNSIWVLNQKDNQGEIVVYGGTFVNWNPADNESEGAHTNFLAPGYAVKTVYQANGDVWYTVVKANNSNNIEIGEGAVVELENEDITGTLSNMGGDLTVTDTKVHNVDAHQYVGLLRDGSYTVFENVTMTSASGGGVNIGNAEAVFESGTISLANTKSRHMFYAGTDNGFAKLTINGGDFTLKNKTATSSYLIAAGEGAVVIVNGGNFNAAAKSAPVQELNGGEVIIKGGTFAWDPSNWVADGYEAVSNGNTWTVQPVNP